MVKWVGRRANGERELSTSQLKAHCSEVVEGVASRRETVIVTRRGRPVAKIVPIDAGEQRALFGCARGVLTIRGDLIDPVDVAWEASD
jgi:prevent-host-death family protein